MLHRMVEEGAGSGGHTPSFLRQCLEYLRANGHSFVSIEDIIDHLSHDKPLPPKPVAFTMDDGFEDQATLAAPVFIEFDCPATLFVVTGMLDEQLWPWFSKVEYLIDHCKENTIELELPSGKKTFTLDTPHQNSKASACIQEEIKGMPWEQVDGMLETISRTTQVDIPLTAPKQYRPITWETARTLEKQGIRLGPHTVSHPILSKTDDIQSTAEITRSWQRLKEELSSPSPVFCYPNGRSADFGQREIDIIKSNGLSGALSTVTGCASKDDPTTSDLYRLPRFGLPGTFDDFIQYSTWIEYAKQRIR